MSFFDDDSSVNLAGKSIVKSRGLYIPTEGIRSPEKLFDGPYDKLKVMTWSYGLNFLVKQMRKFRDVEIVFGHKALVDRQVAAASVAGSLVKEADALAALDNAPGREIAQRVADGSCSFYFAGSRRPSHGKIYLLSDSETGLCRVILGSANMSAAAWAQDGQLETIIYDDHAESYRIYDEQYEEFKRSCSKRFDTLPAALEKLQSGTLVPSDLPLLQTQQPILVASEAEEDAAQAHLICIPDSPLYGGLSQEDLDKLDKCFKPQKDGTYLVLQKNVLELSSEIAQERESREEAVPTLLVDAKGVVTFNGREMHPVGWEDDLRALIDLVEGISSFSNDWRGYQGVIWRLLVWSFLSPFFWRFRRRCRRDHDESKLMAYPMFAFLIGPSNSGKSMLLAAISKLMCGKIVEPLPSDDFAAGSPEKSTKRRPLMMQQNQKGLPIFYDEGVAMGPAPFRKLLCSPMSRRLDCECDGYPAVLMASNVDYPEAQEFRKRALFLHATASLSNEDALRMGSALPSRALEKMRGALFPEFASRIMQSLDDLGAPAGDIYSLASETLIKMMAEIGRKKPDWAEPLNMMMFSGDGDALDSAIVSIERYAVAHPDCVTRNPKSNSLIIRNPDSRDKNAQAQLDQIHDLLPPRLAPSKSAGLVTCSLYELEAYRGEPFGKSNLLDKLKAKLCHGRR